MISIVLYGRNDSYGYNLHKRAALGLNCMAEVLTDDNDEILFVDYNTPDDFPTFPEAIADTLTEKARRRLRIFRVRPEQHLAFANRTHLKVLESVARNAAVRRSNPANRWVLSTNTEMIFIPRIGDSLSEIVADLPNGFYAVPRFEVPESMWESFDRHDPVAVIRDLACWGWNAFLNDVVFAFGTILYDAPGDFQLIERTDLFAVDGFNESMLLGWHVDSNLFRRLTLLHDGAPTSDLADRVFAYHCTHTRELTAPHGRDAPMNDVHTAYWATRPDLPKQRQTWGLPNEAIEEISLDRPPAQIYLDALDATLGAKGSGDLIMSYGGLTYDERHVLPFVLNVFVSAPRSLAIVWLGTSPEMFRLFHAAWRAMEFTGPLFIPTEFAGLLGVRQNPDVQILELKRAFERADAAIFDFAQSDDIGEDIQSVYNVRLQRALARFCVDERLRLETDGALSRRVVTINAIQNAFDPLVRRLLNCTITPYCTRVRTGFVPRRLAEEPLESGNDVLVIVPSRGRPGNARAFAAAFATYSTRSDLLLALDEDDPLLAEYAGIPEVQYELNPRLRLVGTLNLVANKYLERYDYLAFLGDDHRIRTPGWDQVLVEAIEELPAGIAYGNDGHQGVKLPTAVLLNANIVRTLGYLAPPELIHSFKDNFWRDLGTALGSLRYRQEVVLEHLHPAVGKAVYDGLYLESGHPEAVARDQAAYDRYAATRLRLDTMRLESMVNGLRTQRSMPQSDVQRLPSTRTRQLVGSRTNR